MAFNPSSQPRRILAHRGAAQPSPSNDHPVAAAPKASNSPDAVAPVGRRAKAFTPKNIAPTAAVEPLESEQAYAGSDVDAPTPSLTFLRPDRAALDALEANNPRGVDLAQEGARTKALQIMNAVRTLGPAVGAALALGGEDEQQAQRFVETLSLAHTLAQDAATHLELDPTMTKNRWALNMLERMFVEGIAQSMMSGQGPGRPGSAMAAIVMKAAQERAMEKPEYHPLPSQLNVSLALMQAMGPVMIQQQAFDFYRDRDGDLNALSHLLMERAGQAVVDLLDPLTREEDRATVFQVLADEGGKALAGCWKLEADKLRTTLQHKSQSEIDKLLTARPNGFPLENVIEQFEQQFRRLKVLAAQQQIKPKGRAKPAPARP